MFKNSDKEKHTETAIKLLNQYADSYHQLENKVKYLIQENKDLQQNLKINKEIIQSFFKNSSIDKKINVLISNIKSENNLLYSQIEKYKKEIRELTSSLNQMENLKNELNISNNKIFIFENLISQKMNIIQNLNKKISLNKSKKNEHEIYIIDPNIAVNRMNDTLLHYKESNQKLTTHINTLKNTIERKEKEIKNKTNEINMLKKELSHFNKQKNNVEIINQLNQYNAMNSSMNKNTLSKSYNVMHSNELYNILNTNKSNLSNKKKSIYSEIERLENIQKCKKETTEKQFDLTSEWYDTLKHCNMTQEEYINYCNNKNTTKLTDVIEYLYKFVIDKNLQIKLLSEENDYLNCENIKLNKINFELSEEFERKKKIKDDNSTFVNVDNNNISNNLNLNMVMNYMKEVRQSVTSSEFREGMMIDQFDLLSDVNIYSMKNSIKNSEREPNIFDKNLKNLQITESKNIYSNNGNSKCSNGIKI